MGILNQRGFTIIQSLAGAAAMGILALGATTFFQNQNKAQNGIEFHAKREQLRISLIGMFLSNPDNCKCLFNGVSSFPVGGTPVLSGSLPTSLGPYHFTTPGDCSSATVPMPFVNAQGVDGLVSEKIEIRDVVPVSGSYLGNLVIKLSYKKSVVGSQDLQLKIPVALNTTTPSGGMVSFKGCGTVDPTNNVPMTFSTSCRHYMTCDDQAKALCDKQFSGKAYCLKSVYNTKVDAGKREFTVKGFQCTVGTCADGGATDTSGMFTGTSYNCGTDCHPDDAGNLGGVQN